MNNQLSEFYDLALQSGNLIIRKKSRSFVPAILVAVFGIALVIGGLYIHINVVLLGLLLSLSPWISRKWQYPDKITLARSGEVLLETGRIVPNIYRLKGKEITELQVEKVKKYTDTSPFQEGNQEVIYNFFMETTVKRFKLLRLVYRKDEDDKADEVRKFIKQSLGILKRPGQPRMEV